MLTRILYELKTHLDDFILALAPKIIKLILVLIIIFIFNTYLIKTIDNYIKNLKIDSVSSQFIYEVSSLGIKFLYLLLILKSIGISQNTLLTIIGTIGLGISLSLQDSLSNFTAGFIVTTLKPFKIGHYIKVGDIIEGTVREINAFTIGLTSLDQNNVTLPNSFLMKIQ